MGLKENCEEDACEIIPLVKIKDRYYLVHIILYILGIAILLPWNFFITANGYFKYKLTPQHEEDDSLADLFENYLVLAGNIPCTLFLLISPFLHKWISQKTRIIFSVSIVIIVFVVTLILVKIDTNSWQYKFFVITICTIIIMNAANGMFQSCVFALSAIFPPNYMQSMITGQALVGILAPLANIFSLLTAVDQASSAVIYFAVGVVFLIIAVISYLSLLNLPFAQYYLNQSNPSEYSHIQSGVSQHLLHEEKMTNNHEEKLSLLQILRKIWIPSLSALLILFVTLTIYPGITTFIHSVNENNKSPMTGVFFLPVICFLLFNLSDLVGRYVAGWIRWPPEHSSGFHLTLALMRVIFIPLFLLCNIRPHNRLPIVFDSDAYFVAFIFLFGLTNGYLYSLIMMFSPKKVSEVNQESAGSILAAFSAVGILGGSLTSLGLAEILRY